MMMMMKTIQIRSMIQKIKKTLSAIINRIKNNKNNSIRNKIVNKIIKEKLKTLSNFVLMVKKESNMNKIHILLLNKKEIIKISLMEETNTN